MLVNMLACGEIMSREELVSLLNRLRRVGCDLQAVEVKRAEKALPKQLWKTLSAFANASGGVLLLGVDESADFEVVGVANAAQLQADLASLCDQMEPLSSDSSLPMLIRQVKSPTQMCADCTRRWMHLQRLACLETL